MTRFCAVIGTQHAERDLLQMGGTAALLAPGCALGTLADQQPAVGAGPYTVMCAAAGGTTLVGVGQVTLYNRAALRDELATTPHPAPGTCSDGDLLLRYYAYAGAAGFARVSGMFACAIWDGTRLVLVRDAAGARTLFYSRQNGVCAAASSLRALRRWPPLPARINLAAVRSYLTFAYLPGEDTLLDGVRELLPGHYLWVTHDGAATLHAYWHLHEPSSADEQPPEVYAQHVRGLVGEAVHDCLPPDEDVAVFLSGGVDSSLVAAAAARLCTRPLTTYAIHFGTEYTNELAYAELVAAHCGTRHHVLAFSGKQVVAHLPEAMALLDNPVGDPLTAPNLLMARRAAADGFRTTLNGEGGDPVFGGPKNLPMLLFELYRTTADPNARAGAYLRSYRNCYEDLPDLLTPAAQQELQAAPPLAHLVQPYLEAPAMKFYLNRLMLANVHTKGAHHILTKVEALTSACGLEAHSPLFRRELVAYSFVIPPRLKLRGTTEKWVLKEAVRDLLPSLIIERPKSGMRIPLNHWLDGPLGKQVQHVLLGRRGRARGIFQPVTIQAWLRGEDVPWQRAASKLWLLLTLELWLRAYLDNDSP